MAKQSIKDTLERRPELLRQGYDIDFRLAKGTFTIYQVEEGGSSVILEGLTAEEAAAAIRELVGS